MSNSNTSPVQYPLPYKVYKKGLYRNDEILHSCKAENLLQLILMM